MRPKQLTLLRPPLPEPSLFDSPRYRVMVRWNPKEAEVCATTAASKEEGEMWLTELRRQRAYSARLEPISKARQGETP